MIKNKNKTKQKQRNTKRNNKKSPKSINESSNLPASLKALLPPVVKDKESLPKDIQRWWFKRYQLFSKFDQIRMDATGWFSVTPESFALHIAERCRCDTVVDLFVGVGGNAIQFAKTCELVYAIDIDPVRLACSIHNANVYQVDSRIEFILSDALDFIERTRLLPDVIFLSPPWGGPKYAQLDEYIPTEHMPIDWERLLHACLMKTPNLAIYLPKTLSWSTIRSIADLGIDVEVEELYTYNGMRLLILYTGCLVRFPKPAQ